MNTLFVRSIADLSNRWRNHFSRLTARRIDQKRQSGSDHLRLGARGEKLACAFLRRKGYRILSAYEGNGLENGACVTATGRAR